MSLSIPKQMPGATHRMSSFSAPPDDHPPVLARAPELAPTSGEHQVVSLIQATRQRCSRTKIPAKGNNLNYCLESNTYNKDDRVSDFFTFWSNYNEFVEAQARFIPNKNFEYFHKVINFTR
jgi:hypothetical protein